VGTLYLVATPIGNLEDISARAIRILSQVRWIAAEDTRHTGKLLHHFGIQTPMISYHAHNQRSKRQHLLNLLDEGDLALVSDAGTPALNDPGYDLVLAALENGHNVSPIPGPSAPIAALVASGLPTDAFLYLGYLPRKSADRRRLLEKVAALPYTLIFLEAPHRLPETLIDLEKELGDRPLAIARELTKLHEEIFRGRISQARDFYQEHAPKGEFSLVVGGHPPGGIVAWQKEQVQAAIEERLSKGMPPAEIASQLAIESGWKRREIYRLVMEINKPQR
jgi:16S rRNA (cytidine1402-2'-O)-methyltransferase